ncbi:MAG: peptidylprolyl isomerase [Bacteroidota bacterium]|nr:peptidylprolyl isomerase [Bacteroidota bacterium]
MEEKQKQTMVLISTDYGDMKAVLYNETPQHRDNFIQIVNNGVLDSTLFHRVIKGFMIQGGDPNSKTAKKGQMLGNGDLGYKVPAEIFPNLFHKKGALAAARDNNPQKASSACQFYIVQGNVYSEQQLDMMQGRMNKTLSAEQRKAYTTEGGVPHLDGDYTVFGQVIEGLEVIDKIAEVSTDGNDRPLEDIRMKVSILE